MKNGIYGDIYLFNVDKKVWKRQDMKIDCRQSMASTSLGNKILIYGGFSDKFYADANIILIKT